MQSQVQEAEFSEVRPVEKTVMTTFVAHSPVEDPEPVRHRVKNVEKLSRPLLWLVRLVKTLNRSDPVRSNPPSSVLV